MFKIDLKNIIVLIIHASVLLGFGFGLRIGVWNLELDILRLEFEVILKILD